MHFRLDTNSVHIDEVCNAPKGYGNVGVRINAEYWVDGENANGAHACFSVDVSGFNESVSWALRSPYSIDIYNLAFSVRCVKE